MPRAQNEEKKIRLLTRVSFRYLSGERNLVILDIYFGAMNQDQILRNIKKLSEQMREKMLNYQK